MGCRTARLHLADKTNPISAATLGREMCCKLGSASKMRAVYACGAARRAGGRAALMKQHLNTLFVTLDNAYLARQGEAVLVRQEKQTKLRVPVHNAGRHRLLRAHRRQPIADAPLRRAGRGDQPAERQRPVPGADRWLPRRQRPASPRAVSPGRRQRIGDGDRAKHGRRQDRQRQGGADAQRPRLPAIAGCSRYRTGRGATRDQRSMGGGGNESRFAARDRGRRRANLF